MSSNHHTRSTNPAAPFGPSRLCAAYADVLPVLDEPETDAQAAAGARAHLATCRYCQARMDVYARLDAAIARAVGPGATPRRSTEEIMRDLLREDASQMELGRTEAAATTEKAGAGATAEVVVPVAVPPRGSQRPPLPPGSRRRWSGIASLAAVLAVALLATILFAGHVRGGGPSGKGTPAPDWGGRGSETTLAGISMVSATEGWAVGQATPANATNGNQARPLLLHYKNGMWTAMRLSFPGQLSAIAMVSATDGWAMGMGGLILHYDGKVWQRVASPTQGDFTQVRMLSATDGWAVGVWALGDPSATDGLFHYDGHVWTAYALPANLIPSATATRISIYALSMLSSTDGWALGDIGAAGPATPIATPDSFTTVILRYHHGTWSLDDTITHTATTFPSLQSIAMTSTEDGWVVGRLDTPPPSATAPEQPGLFLLHYTNGLWHQVTDPLAGTAYHVSGLFQLTLRAADDGWVVASPLASDATVALHFDGTRWSVVVLPSLAHSVGWYLTGLTYTPAGDLWAIGARLSDASTGAPDGHGGFTPTITPLILHEQHGAWSVDVS